MQMERRSKNGDRRFGFGRRIVPDRRRDAAPVRDDQRKAKERRTGKDRRLSLDRRSSVRRFSSQKKLDQFLSSS